MKKFLMASLVVAGTSWWVGDLAAHGGTYRGPGDTVPPGAGGGGGAGGPTTGGGAGPAGPGAGPPTTGGPTTPTGPGAPGGAGPTTGGDAGPDLTMWSFWWEFNKDPFLNLKAAVFGGATETGDEGFFTGKGSEKEAKDIKRPSTELVYGTIVPALKATLESETNNDIVTGCMIALAKIGDEEVGEGGESEIEQILRPFLQNARQEIRETAALSLGILANKASIPLLSALINDTEEGRKAVGSTEVDLRTRAFAAYGLGLIGYQEKADNSVRQEIVKLLAEALPAAEKAAAPDIAVGLVTSMGLTKLDIGAEPAGDEEAEEVQPWTSRQSQIEFLLDTFNDQSRNRFFRAHLPVAAARLLDDDLKSQESYGALKTRVAEALLLPLDKRKGGDFEVELRQSSALTLGRIGDADDDEIDVKIRKALVEVDDADRQVEKYALIALAKSTARKGDNETPWAGRDEVVKHMLTRMAKGKSGEERWAAMALGVYGNYLAEVGETPSSQIAGALRERLAKAKSTDDKAAYSVSNGIFKNEESKDTLREMLKETSEPQAQGYIALALGMVNDGRSKEAIQELVRESEYQPELLQQAAIALGLLGDKSIVEELTTMLKEASSLATQASLASALGFIGDTRSVDPLVEMLGDSNLTDTARGFAAVALGIVADKELLPWNSKIAVDVNYRASTDTLNAQDGTGLLNIL